MTTIPDLQNLLEYSHPQALRNYELSFPKSKARSSDLFKNMLKYLWLSSKHSVDKAQNPIDNDLNFNLVMQEEMREIDNMWHTFILYTKDYSDFCTHYFGEYLHHQPDMAETNPQTPAEFEINFKKFLSYTYDHLGEQTVRDWFAAYL